MRIRPWSTRRSLSSQRFHHVWLNVIQRFSLIQIPAPSVYKRPFYFSWSYQRLSSDAEVNFSLPSESVPPGS